MTEYGLEPAFVKIEYTTGFGAHSHLICTREWNPVGVGGAMGSYTNWLGGNSDAEQMLDDLVAEMAHQHQNTTTINQATIFTKADEVSPSLPRAVKAYTTAGTGTAAVHTRAIQKTFNFRTVGIHAAKMVFLDVPHDVTDFNKQFPSSWSANDLALFALLNDDLNGWAGRDNTKIVSEVSITWNLNQQLRKQYGMA
jgi:hypothetical protein